MSSKEAKPINIGIKSVQVIEKQLLAGTQPPEPNETFIFKVDIQQNINPKQKLVLATCYVDITSQPTKSLVGRVVVGCAFTVNEFDEYYDSDSNINNFPEAFVVNINSIAISTIRGAMVEIFRGTRLNNVLLPLVDPNQLKPSEAIEDKTRK